MDDSDIPSVGDSYRYAWLVFRMRFPELLLAALVWVVASIPSMILHHRAWLAGAVYDALVVAPLTFGSLALYLRAVRGEAFEAGDVLAAFGRRYRTVVAAHVLFVVLVGAGFAAFVLPGFWIACRLSYVAFLVMDEDQTALGAIRESWYRTAGYGGRIVVFWIVGALAIGAGALLLGVGMVPAAIVAHLAFAAFYVRVAAGDPEADAAPVHSLA